MKPSDVPRNHPNATLSGTTGALATVAVWFSTSVLGLDMDATVGAAVATTLSAFALVLGRRGLRGLLRLMWAGDN